MKNITKSGSDYNVLKSDSTHTQSKYFAGYQLVVN